MNNIGEEVKEEENNNKIGQRKRRIIIRRRNKPAECQNQWICKLQRGEDCGLCNFGVRDC